MKIAENEGHSKGGILPCGLRVERKAKKLVEDPSPEEVPQVREGRIVSAYGLAVSEKNAD